MRNSDSRDRGIGDGFLSLFPQARMISGFVSLILVLTYSLSGGEVRGSVICDAGICVDYLDIDVIWDRVLMRRLV